VHAGDLPEPDLIIVPLGSGGTRQQASSPASLRPASQAACSQSRSPSRHKLFAHKARALARTLIDRSSWPQIEARLEIETSYLGDGLRPRQQRGRARNARSRPASASRSTIPTPPRPSQAALARIAEGREHTILYWQTLSSAPMAPLLRGAPQERRARTGGASVGSLTLWSATDFPRGAGSVVVRWRPCGFHRQARVTRVK